MNEFTVSSVSIDMDEYRELLDIQFRYNNDLRQLRQRVNDAEMDNANLSRILLDILQHLDGAIIDKVSDGELREMVNTDIQRIITGIGRYSIEYFEKLANIKGTDL